MLDKLGSLPTAEKSAAVYRSVFAAAVIPERAGGLDEPDIYEDASRWHLQGKLRGSDVEKLVVLFQLSQFLLGIKISETVLGPL